MYLDRQVEAFVTILLIPILLEELSYNRRPPVPMMFQIVLIFLITPLVSSNI